MNNRSAPTPAPRRVRKEAGKNPGLFQTGLDCSGGEHPGTEVQNIETENVKEPVLPRLDPGSPRELVLRYSEKNFTAALSDRCDKQLPNIETQDKKCFQKGNISRGSTVVSDSDFKSFMHTSESFTNALWVFASHLPSCVSALEKQHSELQGVADVVDKTNRGVKIAGITGGATGAVGGAAAVAGILLAPVTMGASLAITALGVGVAAAGGVTGASAAITNTVKKNQVRKKVETIFQDYQREQKGIERYLNNINKEMGRLQKYDLLTLERVNVKSAKIARLVRIMDRTSTGPSVMSSSSVAIKSFADGMDLFFTKDDNQKLKKESKTRFAQQIRKLAGLIEEGQKELMDTGEKLLSEGIYAQ